MISAALFAGALVAQGAFFAALVAWLLWTHARERRDLLNRLMARDLPEYQRTTAQRPPDTGLHNPIRRSLEQQKPTDE